MVQRELHRQRLADSLHLPAIVTSIERRTQQLRQVNSISRLSIARDQERRKNRGNAVREVAPDPWVVTSAIHGIKGLLEWC